MKEYLPLPAKLADLLQWLHYTDLVIDSHHLSYKLTNTISSQRSHLQSPRGIHTYTNRDEQSVRPHRLLENLQVDEPVGLNCQVCDLVTFIADFQRSATIQNAFVLGLCGDDVLLAGALAVEPSDAFDCLFIGNKIIVYKEEDLKISKAQPYY